MSPELKVDTTKTATSAERQTTLTVEHLLYLLVAVIAAVLRFVNLGRLPLSPAEAEQALNVWNFWQPAGVAAVNGSPAYFSLTSVVTQLAGVSDGGMRLIPAVAGFLLVLLPFWLRPIIGRPAALVTSFLFALSPTFTVTARTAGGDALAMLALVLIFGSWLQYRQSEQTTWLYFGAGALGLGLTSSSLFYGGAVTLLIAAALNHFIGEITEADEGDKDVELANDEVKADEAAESDAEEPNTNSITAEQRNAALIAAGVTLLLSTFALWNTSGLGATAALFTNWFGQFSFNVTVQEWLEPVLALGRYEAAVLLLGTISAAWVTWYGKNQIANLTSYWFIGSLILLLVQAGYMPNVLLLSLPGYLLIGLLLQHIFAQSDKLTDGWVRWPLVFLLLALGGIMATNLGRYARVQLFNPNDSSHLGLAVICALLAIIMIGVVTVWDYRAALQGVLIPILVAFAILNWGQAWRLGHLAANDPRERWVSVGTDDDIRLLVSTMEEISRQTKGSDKSATVFSAIDHPSLRWYLRIFPEAEFGSGVPTGATVDFIIAPSDVEPQLGSSYVGSDFGYYRPEVVHTLDTSAALRWWFFYQSPQNIEEERAVLWLRTALIEPATP